MRRCSRSQQSSETKKIIAVAKNMVKNGSSNSTVFEYIKNSYNEIANDNFGFFDNVQYNKALNSVIKIME